MLPVLAPIMTALPALGPMLTGLLSKISVAVKFVIHQLPMIMEKIVPIVDAVLDIAKSLDMLSKYNSAMELGDTVLQAQNDGVTLDSCNGDVEKYHQEIDKVELSQEKTALFSENEKLSAGLLFICTKLETKLGADVGQLIPLIYRNADFFNADRLSAYVVASTKSDISIGQICNYFSSNLDRKEAINVEAFLVKLESELVVSKDIDSVVSTVKNARE
jgi:hypothetical protein